MPKALIFAPLRNTGTKKDATGAFIPEAREFIKSLALNTQVKFFDNDPSRVFSDRRSDCEHHFSEFTGADIVAFFCHGWKDGIQAGWVKGTIHKLAQSLSKSCSPSPTILLYACDAGRDEDGDRADDTLSGPGGEGGFADMLRDDCRRVGLGATIYAHATEGHCTWNPYVRVFLPDEAAGGRWIIEPRSPLWSAWVKALRNTDMRYRFAFTPKADIEKALRSSHG